MALILRIDVDRSYGRNPLLRHIASRISSDFVFPEIEFFGYLRELYVILELLKRYEAKAHVFFRQCTLPSQSILKDLDENHHVIGLHLENSLNYESFIRETSLLQKRAGRSVEILSKHGSRGGKYGRFHFPVYEPEKYIRWAGMAGMKIFLGNLEDPSIPPSMAENGVKVFPGAFWLEPSWRDTLRFPLEWLISRAKDEDIQMLLHPENVLQDPKITADLHQLLSLLPAKLLA